MIMEKEKIEPELLKILIFNNDCLFDFRCENVYMYSGKVYRVNDSFRGVVISKGKKTVEKFKRL